MGFRRAIVTLVTSSVHTTYLRICPAKSEPKAPASSERPPSRRRRIAGGIWRRYFASGGGVHCLFMTEEDVRAAVPLLNPGPSSASAWGKFGENIGPCVANATTLPPNTDGKYSVNRSAGLAS